MNLGILKLKGTDDQVVTWTLRDKGCLIIPRFVCDFKKRLCAADISGQFGHKI